MRRWKSATVAVAAVALATPTGTAWADDGHGGHGGDDDQITTVATGLSGPRQMDQYEGDTLVVAESDSAEISSVNPYDGDVRTLFSLGTPGTVNPQGVGYSDGQFFIALGETGGPDEAAPPPETEAPPTAPSCEWSAALPPGAGLIVTEPDGTIVARCDLLAAELFYNPDGQDHFAPGTTTPLDSVSNPYAVLVQDNRVLVADAGANTIWSVDRSTGEITPFFTLAVITGGACDSTENNTTPPSNSCDPTPTGVVQGPDGLLYVSGLSGLAQGEGRVYVLDQCANLLWTIDQGLNPLTGIAVDRHGTVYASELFGTVGADGPDGFFADPTQPAGRLVRIDGYGNRSYAPVVTPQGLELVDGSLYAAALSLGPPSPAPAIGQVARVGFDAFAPLPAA